MKASLTGIELIKGFESFAGTSYLCPAGVWTIGYGSTLWDDGRRVVSGETITPIEAVALLMHDLEIFEKCINHNVKQILNQNQFDSLVSFIYNVGCGAFVKSTLLQRINAYSTDPDIHNQFLRWNKGGGQVLPGLTKRRQAEAKLYFTPINIS
jgi:lysozyme